MKNFSILILCLASSAFIGCSSSKYNIDTRIEYNKEDNCTYNCHRIDVYAKNNTSHRFYFNDYKTILNSSLYEFFENKAIRSKISDYVRRARAKQISAPPPCTCKYSKKSLPACFETVAIRKELEIFNEHNELYPYDSILINQVKRSVESKYKKIFFLEPYEECFLFSTYIDYMDPETSKLKYSIIMKKRRGKHRKYLRTKRKGDNTPIESYQGYFDEVAGYKLFKGKSRSNKLIIENGEVRNKKLVNHD